MAAGYRIVTGGWWYRGHEFLATQAEVRWFVNDASLPCLRCTDGDQQSEMVWLSTGI